ncbi:hypothetical protein SAMN05444921_12018 [Streptomyces wuyuanensis]|uniref:Uncharacterized protein n=1 Tax=Streptomyces wuyuanensis TaxID=1196353 RepID=A0A1G9YZS4_9ACTN|nr:hypothetical protein SAMN05444921_12018 [Streptomyces wuyuanensis]
MSRPSAAVGSRLSAAAGGRARDNPADPGGDTPRDEFDNDCQFIEECLFLNVKPQVKGVLSVAITNIVAAFA